MKTKNKLKQKINYVVGDSVLDIKAGKKIKAKTIAVLTGNTSKKKIIKSTKPCTANTWAISWPEIKNNAAN